MIEQNAGGSTAVTRTQALRPGCCSLGPWLRVVTVVCSVLLGGCGTRVELLPGSASRGPVRPDVSQGLRPFWWGDPRLEATLARHGLESLMGHDPAAALCRLQSTLAGSSSLEDREALVELMTRYARRLERAHRDDSIAWYLAAAGGAFRYLSDPVAENGSGVEPGRFLEAYNRATARVVSLVQLPAGGWRSNRVFVACGSEFRVELPLEGALLTGPGYDRWLSADDLEERGLSHHFRTNGVGARLVAVRTNHQQSPLELHQPDEGVFDPATAVLRFAPGGAVTPGMSQRVDLVFYNPTFTTHVRLGARSWPLAADFTMPWAALLAHSRPLAKTRWSSMIRPGRTARPHRLYLMEPYSADRIPIVMVHGLHATTLTWEQLTNELMGDPMIHRRYQIWHYLYPTGLPFLNSAADFRDDLEELRRVVDPKGVDFATRNMVVIGHSMGGLLARTLVTETGEALWDSTFGIPFSQLDPGLEEVLELDRTFHFHPKPYVKRVIFMAVPHRGSKKVEGLVGRFLAGRVHLPEEYDELMDGLHVAAPDLLKPSAARLFRRGYPNSIRALSPRTDALIALADLPIASGVPVHTIVGDRGLGGGVRSSDGIVPYRSAHLDAAESELVVSSGHHLPRNAQAIAEVKRILRLHHSSAQNGSLPPSR